MKFVTFGELLLRLSPEGVGRFVQADRFGAVFGGGEANVAVALAQFGEEAAFVSRLPAHGIGEAAICALRKYGVDVREVQRGGSRIGIYFLEKGMAQRPSVVVYDRAGSAFAEAKASDFDWEKILRGADWFHFSGITAALSPELAKACEEGAAAAHRMGLRVSCDLNYRSKLWTEEQARPVLQRLVRSADLLIGNEEHIGSMLEIDLSRFAREETNLCREGCEAVAAEVTARYGCKTVAITQRRSITACENKFRAFLRRGSESAMSPRYTIQIADRVGSGDAFAAGILYTEAEGFAVQHAVDFAAASCCLKHSVEGDFSLMTAAEVEALASGGGSGAVQR